ncbi:MAG: hypothetical protein U0U09_16590 [Cyclobacteriaceae bacterium]
MKHLLAPLALSIISGCASFEIAPKSDLQIMTKHNYKDLSGHFENYPFEYKGKKTDDPYGYEFAPKLLWTQLTGGKQRSNKGYSVNIQFTSPRRALAKLYDGDSLIASVKLKGHTGDHFFYSKSRIKIIPFFPLVFGYRTYAFRIALRGDNLVIDYNWAYSMSTLIVGAGEDGLSREVFRRISKSDLPL